MKNNAWENDFLDFMEGKTSQIVIDETKSRHLFSQTNFQSSRSKYFGAVNVAMRMHCIKLQERITIMRQYSYIPALLSAWWNFENRLYDLAYQIATIFEEKSIKENGEQPLKMMYQTYFQIVRFGFNNWSTYVLNQNLIETELLSAFALIESNPLTFPFHGFRIIEHILMLLSLVQEKPETSETDFLLLNLISTTFRLFLKHEFQYQPELKDSLQECTYLADMLPLYLKENTAYYMETKTELIRMMKEIQPTLDIYSLRTNIVFSGKQIHYTSRFDSYEYYELMRMIFRVNPVSYMQKQIPEQVKAMAEIFKQSKMNLKSPADSILYFYARHLLPIYKKCDSIVEENLEARKCFAEQFRKVLFPPRLISDPETRFFNSRGGIILHCVWTMCRLISDYVIIISDAFMSYYRPKIDYDVKKNAEESLQEIISEINSLVDREFEHDQVTVLARSSLYIPHQNDAQLVGRARGLIEQAHEPLKMRIAIRELFDIVPYVKSRRDMFEEIGEFIQNQLLSQINPNVELEQSLINSMGQYTEYELIEPLKKVVHEFAHRFDFFDEVKNRIKAPSHVKISILSNQLWKTIVKRGRLSALSEFDPVKRSFEAEYKKKYKNQTIVWCDPSSVVEVKTKLANAKQPELFLFNGVQFSMLKLFEKAYGPVELTQLIAYGQTEDAAEQVEALVNAGLLIPVEGKNSYNLAKSVPISVNRNFAKKYTSAENIALRQLKDEDIGHSVACCIVRLLKHNSNGLTSDDIVHQVTNETIKYFSVQHETIREQIRDLEIKKFIRFNNQTKRFVYI